MTSSGASSCVCGPGDACSDPNCKGTPIPLRDVIEGRATSEEYVQSLKADVDRRLRRRPFLVAQEEPPMPVGIDGSVVERRAKRALRRLFRGC